MPKKLSREAQTARYYRRRTISRICTFVCGIVIRLLAIGVTAVCAYLVFFDAEAITLKGIAAAALFVLLYAQCASFSMLGLRLFARRETRGRGRLALSAYDLCAAVFRCACHFDHSADGACGFFLDCVSDLDFECTADGIGAR